jgi:hypothetical protein
MGGLPLPGTNVFQDWIQALWRFLRRPFETRAPLDDISQDAPETPVTEPNLDAPVQTRAPLDG